MSIGYNGWANYQTWNVALWLYNDYGCYKAMRRVMENIDEPIDDYEAWYNTQRIFSQVFGENSMDEAVTPDDVSVYDLDIDWHEIATIYNGVMNNV